jgi:hypothetical protein
MEGSREHMGPPAKPTMGEAVVEASGTVWDGEDGGRKASMKRKPTRPG